MGAASGILASDPLVDLDRAILNFQLALEYTIVNTLI